MNRIDEQISRLFRVAARASGSEVPAVPYGLETRALAAWRSSRTAQTGLWDVPLLVRGLIVASVIMAASFLPTLSSTSTTSNPFADFLQMTDSTVSTDETP